MGVPGVRRDNSCNANGEEGRAPSLPVSAPLRWGAWSPDLADEAVEHDPLLGHQRVVQLDDQLALHEALGGVVRDLEVADNAPKGLVKGELVVKLNHPLVAEKRIMFNGFVR